MPSEAPLVPREPPFAFQPPETFILNGGQQEFRASSWAAVLQGEGFNAMLMLFGVMTVAEGQQINTITPQSANRNVRSDDGTLAPIEASGSAEAPLTADELDASGRSQKVRRIAQLPVQHQTLQV